MNVTILLHKIYEVNSVKKKISIMIFAVLLLFTAVVPSYLKVTGQDAYAAGTSGELRGVWVSCFDFSSLGLQDKNEKTFRTKVNAFLNKARNDNLNAVFFHVRAYDDAAWKSRTFPAMKYLSSKSSRKKTAAKTYTYDPMKIVIELAHEKGMEFHAWMNPYRKNSSGTYYNPAYNSTNDRVVKAVDEILKYDVDGIHFDDYFYNGTKYVNLDNKKVLKSKNKPSYKKRMKYVNKMISRVYSTVKSDRPGAVFGISPQGNMENAKALGCDIDTWMSKKGYVDYIMPQLYWTDNWGSQGKTKMFTRTLNNWPADGLNKVGMPVYIGLALYKSSGWTGDPGWKRSSSNLSEQLKMLRKKKCNGYVLFSAKDLYRKGASKEIANLNKVV